LGRGACKLVTGCAGFGIPKETGNIDIFEGGEWEGILDIWGCWAIRNDPEKGAEGLVGNL
jgi:hypothetical protein